MHRTFFLFLVFVLPLSAGEPVTVETNDRPQLAVLISIDQCRADYLERFRPWFVVGGFRRLLEKGALFTEAHHRHAMTATAPGHATIATGVHANVHGIVANEWFDFAAGRPVVAVEDPLSPIVGAAPTTVRIPAAAGDVVRTASPRQLKAVTVGDQLKLRYGSQCRVIALTNKDRAAIFMGGRLADAAYWMHEGRFVTSRYYRETLPEWMEKFNAENRIDHAFGHTWDRLLEKSIYDSVQGPDDAEGEESRLGLGVTFPRKVDGGEPAIGKMFYEAYRLDPQSSELLGQIAQQAIVAEQLGKHAAPDLLCLGFSQLDYAGHSYGPDSHEIMDSVLRLDRVLAELLTFLDIQVGAGRYVVVVTADHGVSPLPERVKGFNRDLPAGRIDYPTLTREVEAALTTAFGAPTNDAAWTIRDSYGYRLIPTTLTARGVTSSAAQLVIKSTLLRSAQVAVVWTRDELLGLIPAQGQYLDQWRLSFNPALSQDVVFSPPPYVVDRSPFGSNHGTPYDFDNHVPLVWYGKGVPTGVRIDHVGTDAIAPTLARLLGVPRPPEARAGPLF